MIVELADADGCECVRASGVTPYSAGCAWLGWVISMFSAGDALGGESDGHGVRCEPQGSSAKPGLAG